MKIDRDAEYLEGVIVELQRILKEAAADIKELRTIVDKLPKAIDGVHIVPGVDPVYRRYHLGKGEFCIDERIDTARHLIEASYSTREAAEAAREQDDDD